MSVSEKSDAVVNSKDKIRLMGKIKKVLPGSEYLVQVDINNKSYELTGYISGKMRKNYIKLAAEDKVEVEMTPYDISKCRIVYRHRNDSFQSTPRKA
jgi:translation initiation factor IF-1